MAFLNIQTLLLALITVVPATWLCFYSRRNLTTSRIVAAFLLAWLIVGTLDRAIIVMLAAGTISGIAAGVLSVINTELTPRLLPFLCGGLVGVKLIQAAGYSGASHIGVLLLVVMMTAAAIMLLAVRFGGRVEVIAAAAAGAGALFAGVGMIPLASRIAFPGEITGTAIALVAWLGLTIAGSVFQLRDSGR